MVLRKYACNKNLNDEDDFRHALNFIIKQKNNDELFSQHLTKKSGRSQPPAQERSSRRNVHSV